MNKIYIAINEYGFNVYSTLEECRMKIGSLNIPYKYEVYEIDLNNLQKRRIEVLDSKNYFEFILNNVAN